MSFDNLKYLNIKELRHICDKFDIPYGIYVEHTNGLLSKINDMDSKSVMIDKIKMCVDPMTNNIICDSKKLLTVYTQKIINYDITEINKDTYVYYGLYNTTNIRILKLMKELTDNKFKFGAVSQKIIRNIWRKNILITFEEFANMYLNYKDNFDELAYNDFIKNSGNKSKWFKFKSKIVKEYKTLIE